MGQMALGTSGADTMGVVAAMNIGVMCPFKRFHAVAADTKLRV